MDEMTYAMDFEDRKQFVIEKISEVLQNDSDLFVQACEELDNWNGFLGDARCWDMWEIDEFFNKPSDLLDRMSDFDSNDEYFYFDIYGVTTSSDKYDVYSDNVDVDDLVDGLIDNYNHLDIDNATLEALLEVVWSDDFGIEDGWECNEDYDFVDCDDLPEETDDEFMDRINDLV